jgi:hypothetical protein
MAGPPLDITEIDGSMPSGIDVAAIGGGIVGMSSRPDARAQARRA